MAKIVHFGLTAAAAFLLATCGGNVLANNANAGGTPEKNASAEPVEVALMTLEKSAYEAWEIWGQTGSSLLFPFARIKIGSKSAKSILQLPLERSTIFSILQPATLMEVAMLTVPRASALLIVSAFSVFSVGCRKEQHAVTTYHYDNMRTGWNHQEKELTYDKVKS